MGLAGAFGGVEDFAQRFVSLIEEEGEGVRDRQAVEEHDGKECFGEVLKVNTDCREVGRTHSWVERLS